MEQLQLAITTSIDLYYNHSTMYNPLFIYPNFTYSQPGQKQFERFLLALKDCCRLNIVTRTGPITLSSVYNPYYTHGSYAFWLSGILKRTIPDLAYIPDILRWTVNPFLMKGVDKAMLDQKTIDFITTLSYPLSCHLVGLEAKRKYGIPWIAIFYDPWTDNPYRHYKTKYFRHYDARMEKLVAENADIILHTNQVMCDIWSHRYGKSVEGKLHVLPFCYTEEMVAKEIPLKVRRTDKIILSYIGQAVGNRNLQDFIKALAEMRDEGLDVSKFEIRCIGIPYTPDQNLAKELGVSDLFIFTGMLQADALPVYYDESDAFIVVDAPMSRNIFFPSKLMDYFYYRRPIIGITSRFGITAELLKASNNKFLVNGDIKGLKKLLTDMLVDNGPSWIFDENYYQNFTPSVLCSNFDKIIKKIIRK